MSNATLEKVGRVTPEERDEIQRLFNRKMSLRELIMVLQENSQKEGKVDDNLYERVLRDIEETGQKFQKWWDDMGAKYQWKGHERGFWRIDFQTCDIFLETPNN